MDILKKKRIKVRLIEDVPKNDGKLRSASAVFVKSPFDHYGVLFQGDEIRRVLAKSRFLRHYISIQF